MRRARLAGHARARDATRVPAGGALAVDRERFSAEVTRRIDAHPRIERVAAKSSAIPDARPVVLATGPLTGDALARDLARAIGGEHLAYYDSIAPIVAADSHRLGARCFAASRYDKGGDDAYVNCPLDEAQYHAFVAALRRGREGGAARVRGACATSRAACRSR